MTGTAKNGGQSLTGVWRGLYSYPGQGEPVSFVATLIQSGSAISGATHETCAVSNRRRETLGAFLSGVRAGASVNFVKSYDGSAGWTHSVAYEGGLNADATEIDGRWNIDGRLAGKFMMIREAGKDIEVRREVLEKA